MSLPFRVGEQVPSDAWHAIRRRAMFECCKWDVQSYDHCVLADFPLYLNRGAWAELYSIAEELAAESLAAEAELVSRPELLVSLGVPVAFIRELERNALQQARGPRLMRFDFHWTDEGWQISEVNSDVPGGFVEGSGFTELMAEHFGAEAPSGTAKAYIQAILRSAKPEGVIAMAHATAYSDDRQVMEYLARLIRKCDREVVQVSPVHLKWNGEGARVRSRFSEQDIAAIVRFFPADWLAKMKGWGPYLDGCGVPISNPATALLIQSKAFPVMWDRMETDLSLWRKLLPETRTAAGLGEKVEAGWVLKPVFGRVGEGVGMVGVTPEKEMRAILRSARSDVKNWVMQRRFRVVPVPSRWGDLYPCLGMYTIDKYAVGAYARVAHKPLTDDEAQDIAVLFED